MSQSISNEAAQREVAQQGARPSKQRLLSLDVFRGLTLALMVLVNNPGDHKYVYAPFSHMKWHGWTPTDLVFPFFIFVVGVAIPFAFASRVARGESRGKLYLQILRRTVVLFVLGLFLNGFPGYDLSALRYMGILQRIALCYMAGSIIYLHWKPRTQAIIAASLLVFYFVILKFVPPPGLPAPTLEEQGNWVQFFDLMFMRGHLQSATFEGKGLLSTLPAIANCLFGLLTGEFLRTKHEPLEKVARMFTAGTAAMFLGAVWSLWFPINQNLWTSSLVMLMSGMALTILACCYYVIDIRQSIRWTKPFIIFGVNSITVWMGSTLLRDILDLIKLQQAGGRSISVWTAAGHWFASWAGAYNGSLLFALTYVLLWLGLMAVLYRRGIFLKI